MLLQHTFTVDAHWRSVAELIISPAYNEQAEGLRRSTVVSARYVPLASDPRGASFEVHSREHNRTRMGAVKRSEIVDTVTRFQWSHGARTLTWRYEGVGKRVLELSGRVLLAPTGARTRVSCCVDVDVRVPLVGRIVGRAVAGAFERGFAAERELMIRHFAGASPELAA